MKEIKTFEELYDIETKEYRAACSLDLMLVRNGLIIADGYCLMLGADCKTHLELYLITFETYNNFSDNHKNYIKHKYYGFSKD